MRESPRVLIAGLFHETHTFVAGRTGLADFAVTRGDEMLARTGDSSPMGGALEAAARLGWQVVPAIDARAMPSAMVTDEVVETVWREFERAARAAEPVDGVCLILHGAMVAESFEDATGEFLARIRSMPSLAGVPLFGVLDLHANGTARMARSADCLLAYRENPHTDARESAVRAVELLDRSLRTGVRPRTVWRRVPILWPPTGTGTADEPMRTLERMAREMESRPDFWCVNVLAGFSFADVPDAGVSFSVVTSGPIDRAEAALDELCGRAWELREWGNRVDPDADEVIARLAAGGPSPGPIVIAEPADNIGGGAPGDATCLLRSLLKFNITGAAVAICDAAAVDALGGTPVGASLPLSIGGKGSALDPGPVTLTVQLLSRSDGRFALEDKQSHLASVSGDVYDMGPCAVVRHAGVTILLTSRPTPPMDLGQWRSQGIDPSTLNVIGVKAAVAHRRAYEPIAGQMLSVETPGPCTSRLASLPYRKVRRPVFPLDPG